LTGIVESITRKDGQYGTYYNLTISGEQYAAFNAASNQAASINQGDNVSFEWTPKGKYKNITSISRATNGSGAGPVTAQPGVAGRQSAGVPSRSEEFNLMMATRYALDSIIAGKAKDATEAASLIRGIYTALKADVKESQSPS
jgi:hypothetical protein